jgi:hypothetical protein
MLDDCEFSDPGDFSWTRISSKTLPASKFEPSTPPLLGLSENDFADASPDDVFQFVVHNVEGFKALGFDEITSWVILDAKGIETSTCLFALPIYKYDETSHEGSYTDKYRFVRVPLDIA